MTDTHHVLTSWIAPDDRDGFFWVGAAAGLCIAGVLTALGAASSPTFVLAGLISAILGAAVLYSGGEP